jgi:polyisoprenoid-binding protein YceI
MGTNMATTIAVTAFKARALRVARVRMLRTLSALVYLSAALSSAARASDVVVPVTARQTTVEWTLGAFLHSVHGTFAVKDGSLHFDPQTNSIRGTVVIDLTMGKTGDAKRDRRMHDDVLETDKYPVATFTARSISGRLEPNGPSQFSVAGTLLMHGAPHDLTLPLQVIARDGSVESGETHFVIPYVAWGMHDPSTFVLRVDNYVNVDVKMTRSSAATPAP